MKNILDSYLLVSKYGPLDARLYLVINSDEPTSEELETIVNPYINMHIFAYKKISKTKVEFVAEYKVLSTKKNDNGVVVIESIEKIEDIKNVSQLTNDLGYLVNDDLADYAKTEYVNAEIAKLPKTLDELERYIQSDLITAQELNLLDAALRKIIPSKIADLTDANDYVKQSTLDELVGSDNVEGAIDTINEIKKFLTGFDAADALISLKSIIDSKINSSDIADWAKASEKPVYTYDEIEGTPTIDAYSKSEVYTKTEIDLIISNNEDATTVAIGQLTEKINNDIDLVYKDMQSAYDDTEVKSRLDALEAKEDADTVYDDTEVKSRLDALEAKEDADTVYDDTEVKSRLEDIESKYVDYKPFEYHGEQRHTIQLSNHDTISGIGANCEAGLPNGYEGGENLEGKGFNLVMLSKWNVADFGSTGVSMNLNAKDGIVKINDDKIIATTDQLTDAYDDTEVKSRLDALEAKEDADTVYDDTEVKSRLDALEAKEDADTVYDDTEVKSRLEDIESKYVDYKPFEYHGEQRHTIQLANHDTISGIGANCEDGQPNGYEGGENLEGKGFNLVMLSKWNVADFGSTGVAMNLNAKDGIVKINDKQVIATESYVNNAIKDLKNYDDAELVNRIAILEAKEDADTVYDDTEVKSRLDALEAKEDADTVYDDTEVKSRLEDIEASYVEENTVNALLNKVELLASRVKILESMQSSLEVVNDATQLQNIVKPLTTNVVLNSSEAVNSLTENKTYKTLTLVNSEIDENKIIVAKAVDKVSVNNLYVENDTRTSQAGAHGKIDYTTPILDINGVTTGDNLIAYNLFEGSQKPNDPSTLNKSVNVSDLTVNSPSLTHNIINVYTPDNNAEIVFENCYLNLNMQKTNALRISNTPNSSNVSITFKNVVWTYENVDYTEGDIPWAGLILYQPYNTDAALTNDLSYISTWNINIIDCYYEQKDGTRTPITDFGWNTAHQIGYGWKINNVAQSVDLSTIMNVNISHSKQ